MIFVKVTMYLELILQIASLIYLLQEIVQGCGASCTNEVHKNIQQFGAKYLF